MDNCKILTGDELSQALDWLDLATKSARESQCLGRRCGSVLISANHAILTSAENKLPGQVGQAHVHCSPYNLNPGFKSDKGCCIHAEERLVMRALSERYDFAGSILVFASVDENGQRLPSGQPYCTICSKMALEAGIALWILEHADRVVRYEAAYYNQISFAYKGI